MSAGIARARKCEAIHFFVFYKSRTAAARMGELARTAVQTLDGLDDMSNDENSRSKFSSLSRYSPNDHTSMVAWLITSRKEDGSPDCE